MLLIISLLLKYAPLTLAMLILQSLEKEKEEGQGSS
jgi:hypothetical protein